jgi:hypothetical protein
MRNTLNVVDRERNKQTRFRDNTVRLDVCDFVKCEANIRAVQRLKITLIAHNTLASDRYKMFTPDGRS